MGMHVAPVVLAASGAGLDETELELYLTDNAATVRSTIGAGTSSLTIGTTSSTAKAGDYQPTAADISDASTVGRNVLTASTQANARIAIGAGTSSLALGTSSSTAKAGDYQPASTDISDSTATGRSVLTAASQSAARSAIGAGTSNVTIGTASTQAKAGDYQPASTNISDSTATGRSLLTAASASAARTVLGTIVAGTGVTSSGRIVEVATVGDYPSAVTGGGLAGDFVVVLGA